MFEAAATQRVTPVTLYTDSYSVRGTLRAPERPLSDVLNASEQDYLLLEDVKFEEFGSHALVEDVPYAQVNLANVLFAVTASPMEAAPDMRAAGMPEEAIISVPPFRITGRLHLPDERELRDGLTGLAGRFVAVSDATFWSEKLNEPRTSASTLAFSHARAHILAPHAQRDVWAGLGTGSPSADAGTAPMSAEDRERIERLAADPWRDVR